MKYFLLPALWSVSLAIFAQAPPTWDFDSQLQQYFAAASEQIAEQNKTELSQVTDWTDWLTQSRPEMQDMLGLLPFPEKTPLKATITGTIEHEEFTVHKLHFQSMPGLYVTGNLYIPKNIQGKVPAVIYVCGHATVQKNGYNYGAKAHYQHHPAWFARHGYVCLILDTVQLGEIEGIHHGLYRYDRWWWLSRGYTPAGVEAWNAIRAVDYLLTRPEVDGGRIGITGRSGGGVVSWWTAAVDERIQVAVPVAGITDMEDYVVNKCVQEHCDCMFMANTYRWDFPKVAALLAPRPLLISNTDRDPMFPIEGVFRTYRQVRKVYESMGAGDQLALNVTSGPHQDVQELRIAAFRWLDHYLYGRDELIEKPAVKFFEPEQLRVFDELPADAINTRIDEVFNAVAPRAAEVLQQLSWEEAKTQWMKGLGEVFKSWPKNREQAQLQKLESRTSADLTLTTFALRTDEHTSLPLFHLSAARGAGRKPARVIVLDDTTWPVWASRLAGIFPGGDFLQEQPTDPQGATAIKNMLDEHREIYLLSCRGNGPARFSGNDFHQDQIRRSYYLLGQTLETMQTWDLLRAWEAITAENRNAAPATVALEASGVSAGLAVYAALFAAPGSSLHLTDLPPSHMQGPHYLKVLRYLDLPAAVLMAAERHQIVLDGGGAEWDRVVELAGGIGGLSLEKL